VRNVQDLQAERRMVYSLGTYDLQATVISKNLKPTLRRRQ